MKKSFAIMFVLSVFVSSCVAFAQGAPAPSGSVTALPSDITGHYTGTFHNVTNIFSSMGFGATIGEKSGTITMYAGTCSGIAQAVTVKNLGNNKYELTTVAKEEERKVGVSCPARLEVTIENGKMEGRMFGLGTYDISLTKN